MQAAPIAAMDAVWAGWAVPWRIMPAMLRATWRPMTADASRARRTRCDHRALGLVRGVGMACGGAIPIPILRTRWHTAGPGSLRRVYDERTGMPPEFEALRWFPLPRACLQGRSARTVEIG